MTRTESSREPSETFRVKCPMCTKTIRAQKSMRGRIAKCPRCEGEFLLPARSKVESAEQSLNSPISITPISVTRNGATLGSRSKQSTEIPRSVLLTAWILVGLFAVASFVFCLWYLREQKEATVEAADLRVSQAIADAKQWIAGEDELAKWKVVETNLIVALSDDLVSNKRAGQTLLDLVGQHVQARQIWHDARQLVQQGRGQEAAVLLKQYVVHARVEHLGEAQWMLNELETANSDSEAMALLLALDEASISELEKSGTINDPRVTRPEIKAIQADTVKRVLPVEKKRREALLAEQRQLEEERQLAEQVRQQAEEKRLREELDRRRKLDKRLEQLAKDPTELERFLHAGDFTAGLLEFQTQLIADPQNDDLRFQLALTEFFGGVERFGQALHRYGLKESIDSVPFLRLPVPPAPNPDPISYAIFRRTINDLIRDFDRVDSTLARIESDDVAVSLRLGLIRFDMDDDGNAEQELTAILKKLHQQEFAFLQNDETLPVDFDRGDVTWLRIYCQLMSAVLDFAMAFDFEAGFDTAAEQFFENPDVGNRVWDDEPRLRIVEPRRLGRFRRRVILITELNHAMWKQIRAETDNSLEWLPNSDQQSVLGFTVSDPLVDSWLAAMTEVGAALQGQQVIQGFFFVREDNKGLNLKNVLEDPPVFISKDAPLSIFTDKYFTEGRTFNLNSLMEFYTNYSKWIGSDCGVGF
jgi:hypothetical protein